MMNWVKWLSRPWVFWLTAQFMFGLIIAYFFYTGASPAVQKDLWRYLPIVSNYYDSGFSFSILLLKHGEHLQLAYNAWFLLNSLLFDLNTRLELFIGLCFLGGFAALLYRPFIASFDAEVTITHRRWGFLLLLGIVFSFHQLVSLVYSLLAFAAFGEALCMMLFLIALDRALINKRDDWRNWLAMLAFFILLGAGFAGGGWVIYLCSSFVSLFAWWASGQSQARLLGRLVIALLAMALPVYWVNTLAVVPSAQNSSLSALLYATQHLAEVCVYLITLLANGVVDINLMEKSGHETVVYVAGVSLGVAYLYATYLFFRARLWERTYIPLFMMAFFWFVALVLVLFRLPISGIENAASPRYVTTLQIGMIGVVWTLLAAKTRSNVISSGVGRAIIGTVIVLLYVFYLKAAFYAAPFIRQIGENSVDIVKNEKFSETSSTCPHELVCKEGIGVLKDHRLNVFSK